MSKYTTEVRWLCEYESTNDIRTYLINSSNTVLKTYKSPLRNVETFVNELVQFIHEIPDIPESAEVILDRAILTVLEGTGDAEEIEDLCNWVIKGRRVIEDGEWVLIPGIEDTNLQIYESYEIKRSVIKYLDNKYRPFVVSDFNDIAGNILKVYELKDSVRFSLRQQLRDVLFYCHSNQINIVSLAQINDIAYTIKDTLKIGDIIENSADNIFDFEFPIFDETYRLPLEKKILKHYYTREICEETVSLWKLRLDDRLNMIMPYYNKLYESELLKFNPLYDVDLTRTQVRENEGNEITSNNESENLNANENKSRNAKTENSGIYETESSGERDGTASRNDSQTGTSWDLYSDTPQGGVNGLNNATDSIADNSYLTNARKLTNENEANSASSSHDTNANIETGSNANENETNENEIRGHTSERSRNTDGVKALSSTEDYLEHVMGKQGSGSYSKLLQEFRKTFLNIDRMVIDELSDLFFGLWD